MSYCHLHLHTTFSANDGMCHPERTVEKAVSVGMSAIAGTDHGTMAGLPELAKACSEYNRKHGSKVIRMIAGMEPYVFMSSQIIQPEKKGTVKQDTGHLTLLAKNAEGYANLVQLSTLGYKDNVYRNKPRIDISDVMKHHEGLIVLTGCMFSWFNLLILRHYHLMREVVEDTTYDFVDPHDPFYYYTVDKYRKDDKDPVWYPIGGKPYEGEFLIEARRRYTMLREVFGDDLYIEVQDHGVKQQKAIRDFWAESFPGVKCVVTNDVHYIEQKEWEAQDFITRIRWGGNERSYLLKQVMQDQIKETYFKTEAEMLQLPVEKAHIEMTMEVVDKCDFEFDKNRKLFPTVSQKIAANMQAAGTDNTIDFIRKCCIESSRWPKKKEEVEKWTARMEHELAVIDKTGYADYFLIVQDIIRYSREDLLQEPGVGRGCFLPYTAVVVKDGFTLPIQDISIGSQVETRYGLREVTNTFQYDISEDIIVLTMEDGRRIRCTGDHKILIRNGQVAIWKAAKDIEEGDDILTLSEARDILRVSRGSTDERKKDKVRFGRGSSFGCKKSPRRKTST